MVFAAMPARVLALLIFSVAVALAVDGGAPPVVEAHGFATTIRAQHSDKCLTVHPGDQSNGALAYQWTCGAGNNVEIVDAGGGEAGTTSSSSTAASV